MIIPNFPERMVFPVGATYRLYLICKKKKKHEIISVQRLRAHNTQVCVLWALSRSDMSLHFKQFTLCSFQALTFLKYLLKQIFVSGESDFVYILVCSTATVSLFQTGCGEGVSELVNERIVTTHYSLLLLNSQVTYYGSVSK